MMKCIKAFVKDNAGALAPMAAVLLPVLLGMTGLGVDAGFWMMQKRNLQAAVDAASISAAWEYAHGITDQQTLDETALRSAEINGYKSASADSSITVQSETINGYDRIQVLLRQPDNSYFSRILFKKDVFVSVSATSEIIPNPYPPCVLSLSQSAPEAIIVDSNSSIDVTGCSIQANSSADNALVTSGNAGLSAEHICVNGGYEQNNQSTASPDPQTTCPDILDPFESLAAPAEAEDACDYNNLIVNTNITLNPGVYCGGIDVRSNKNVTFNPGTYVIKDGPLKLRSNSSGTGAGVFFYFTGNNGVIDFDSNSAIDFTPPASGDYNGTLFYQDRNFGGTHRLNSNTANNLDGLIYLPQAHLEIDSNVNLGGPGSCLQFITNTLHFDSNASLVINPDMQNCPNYANASQNTQIVRLIQ